VTKLELLVDGKLEATASAAPFSFSWDTSKRPDGIAKHSLKAYVGGTAVDGKDLLPVIVLNNGSEVSWKDGNSGKVIVPASGYVDQHLKHHWTMPGGVKKVIALLHWDVPGFKLELQIGVGECPDNGTTAAKAESEISPTVVEWGPASGTIPANAMWFAHVQLMNSAKVLGKETPFSLKAFLIN
jgi:hypothetical protein